MRTRQHNGGGSEAIVNPNTEQTDRELPLGLASLILAMIGLVLFFLPILGIPISAIALIAGGAGWMVSMIWKIGSLRWAVGGMALSALALSLNLAIAYAPATDIPSRGFVPVLAVPDRPYIPPPSRFDY